MSAMRRGSLFSFPPPLLSYSSLPRRKEKISKKDFSSASMCCFDKMGADNVKRLPETKLPCKPPLVASGALSSVLKKGVAFSFEAPETS